MSSASRGRSGMSRGSIGKESIDKGGVNLFNIKPQVEENGLLIGARLPWSRTV